MTPEEVTSAGMRASAARSAETSGGVGKPRCTPPSPPVPMKRMPTAAAAVSVPPTVVAPATPWTAQTARSRGPSLRTSGVNRSSSASVSPIRTRPSSTPIVAGIAPAARTASSLARATATPSGAGKPCATSVVSSATTARVVLERGLDLLGDDDQIEHAPTVVVVQRLLGGHEKFDPYRHDVAVLRNTASASARYALEGAGMKYYDTYQDWRQGRNDQRLNSTGAPHQKSAEVRAGMSDARRYLKPVSSFRFQIFENRAVLALRLFGGDRR